MSRFTVSNVAFRSNNSIIDRGKEFMSVLSQEFFKDKKINHYTTASRFKALVCERWNRTLKNLLYKFFTYSKTKRFVEVLPQLVDEYNSREHSVTKMIPNDVSYYNQHLLFLDGVRDRYDLSTDNQKPKYVLNDAVRFAKAKLPFSRGFEKTFTDEIFYVSSISRSPLITYKIVDDRGIVVETRFYEQELVRADD